MKEVKERLQVRSRTTVRPRTIKTFIVSLPNTEKYFVLAANYVVHK